MQWLVYHVMSVHACPQLLQYFPGVHRKPAWLRAGCKLNNPLSPPCLPAAPPSNEQEAAAAATEVAEAEAAALDIVAEMQLTAEQLKAELRALPQGFGAVFPSGKAVASERRCSACMLQTLCQQCIHGQCCKRSCCWAMAAAFKITNSYP